MKLEKIGEYLFVFILACASITAILFVFKEMFYWERSIACTRVTEIGNDTITDIRPIYVCDF